MRPVTVRLNRGASFRSGKRPSSGFALKARNSRYLPGDQRMRLWALLGRQKAGTMELAGAPLPPDAEVIRALYHWIGDDLTKVTQPSKLWCVKGNAIYETSLTSPGEPTRVFGFGASKAWTTTRPCAYEDYAFYAIGDGGGAGYPYLIGRDADGWFYASHKDPTLTSGSLLTAAAVGEGSGSFESSTTIKYVARIYDSATDTESAHLDEVSVAAFTKAEYVGLTFAELAAEYALGTHVRIYRTLLDEAAGIYYRIDGSDEGIDIADFAAGFTYTYQDTTTNETAQTYGIVRADGEEGQAGWAEHGGIPPKARGLTAFKNHLVAYGISGRDNDIIYSAQGYPMSFPVDWTYDYQYWLRFVSPSNDTIKVALPVGNYLIVWGKTGIWRVSSLPTYTTPGFDRVIQDQFVTDHGCCGRFAADNFGIGAEESSHAIYTNAQHGICYTDGVFARPVLLNANWLESVNKAELSRVVVQNYPRFQEVWIFYPGVGSTFNNQALIVNYEHVATVGIGLRVTGPVDVRGTAACAAVDDAGRARMYLVDDDRTVYVQDVGETDEQENTNSDGDIAVEWETPRRFPNGQSNMATVSRALLGGTSGTEKQFTVEHKTLDGKDEFNTHEKVKIGPGETVDQFLVKSTGQGHRTNLSYTGPTGSSYDEDEAECAPCFDQLEYEVDASGRQHRTRTA